MLKLRNPKDKRFSKSLVAKAWIWSIQRRGGETTSVGSSCAKLQSLTLKTTAFAKSLAKTPYVEVLRCSRLGLVPLAAALFSVGRWCSESSRLVLSYGSAMSDG
ncbi:MAG: hypothetical protein ACKESB_00940 [Candidatus Hodgkinia cicadicola]